MNASCGPYRHLELHSSSSYCLRKCYVRYNLSEHLLLPHQPGTQNLTGTPCTRGQKSLPFMLTRAERSSRQDISVLPVEKLRKQYMNLRAGVCLELFLLLLKESRLLEYTTCCFSQPLSPPAVSYLPATDPILLLHSDPFLLAYEKYLCLLQKKQKLSCFTGVCGYCGAASMSAFQGLQPVYIAEKLQCGLRHS